MIWPWVALGIALFIFLMAVRFELKGLARMEELCGEIQIHGQRDIEAARCARVLAERITNAREIEERLEVVESKLRRAGLI